MGRTPVVSLNVHISLPYASSLVGEEAESWQICDSRLLHRHPGLHFHVERSGQSSAT